MNKRLANSIAIGVLWLAAAITVATIVGQMPPSALTP